MLWTDVQAWMTPVAVWIIPNKIIRNRTKMATQKVYHWTRFLLSNHHCEIVLGSDSVNSSEAAPTKMSNVIYPAKLVWDLILRNQGNGFSAVSWTKEHNIDCCVRLGGTGSPVFRRRKTRVACSCCIISQAIHKRRSYALVYRFFHTV